MADLASKTAEEAANTITLFANVAENTAAVSATASEKSNELQASIQVRCKTCVSQCHCKTPHSHNT